MRTNISSTSLDILRLIAQGHTYEQIVTTLPDCTYVDIFNAAQEVLNALDRRRREKREKNEDRYAEIRKIHPRAYLPWSPEEVQELKSLFTHRLSVEDIAEKLQRQPGAIKSRLVKLKLIDDS